MGLGAITSLTELENRRRRADDADGADANCFGESALGTQIFIVRRIAMGERCHNLKI
jgi:hypothetical protein